MNALAASNRFLVFCILDSLMAHQRESLSKLSLSPSYISLLWKALKSMRKEFLSGYVTLVEGEKDPRNLMTAFAIARVILIEFDITDHIEVCFVFLDSVEP